MRTAIISVLISACFVGEAGSTYGTLHVSATDGEGQAVADVVIAVDFSSLPHPGDQITNESGEFDRSGPEGVWRLMLRDSECYDVPASQATEMTVRVRRLQTTGVTVMVAPDVCEPSATLP